jgi:polysaccharide export outer membrane protein
MAGTARVLIAVLTLAVAALIPLEAARAQTPTGNNPPFQSVQQDAVTLQPGDGLQISVWPDQTLGGQFLVEETGNVYLPFLGSVQVVGMPISRLRDQLRAGYAEVMKEPVVTITPLFKVGVMGAVRGPGTYTIDPTFDIVDVIQQAGGFTDRAKQSDIKIVRPGEVLQYNVQRALEEGADLSELTLRSGDNIIVPNKSSFNVQTAIGFFNFAVSTALLIDRLIDGGNNNSSSN